MRHGLGCASEGSGGQRHFAGALLTLCLVPTMLIAFARSEPHFRPKPELRGATERFRGGRKVLRRNAH